MDHRPTATAALVSAAILAAGALGLSAPSAAALPARVAVQHEHRPGHNDAGGRRIPGSVVIGHQDGFVSAHRGPNSLAAAQITLRHFYNDIENDAQRTADGNYYLWHDPDVRRCTGESAPYLRSMTTAQVRRVRCNGYPLASLGEVARLVKAQPHRTWYVELKVPLGATSAQRTRDAEGLAEHLEHAGVSSQTIVDTFATSVLPVLLAANPALTCSYLDSTPARDDVDRARDAGCTTYSSDVAHLDASVYDYAHDQGLRVNVFHTTTYALALAARRAGADTVSSDDPVALRGHFGG